MKIINRSKMTDHYGQISSYGIVHGIKLPSLEEFLALALNEKPTGQSVFDDTVDKKMDEIAAQRLEEMRAAANGK